MNIKNIYTPFYCWISNSSIAFFPFIRYNIISENAKRIKGEAAVQEYKGHALEKKKNNKDVNDDFKEAKDYLDQAADGLRRSKRQDYLPRALLIRAAFYRIQEKFSQAWQDLNEALEIAELGSMKLFLADYHLEAGRLCLAEKKIPEAKKHFNTAKQMIDKMGYHRRDQEVLDLDSSLNC